MPCSVRRLEVGEAGARRACVGEVDTGDRSPGCRPDVVRPPARAVASLARAEGERPAAAWLRPTASTEAAVVRVEGDLPASPAARAVEGERPARAWSLSVSATFEWRAEVVRAAGECVAWGFDGWFAVRELRRAAGEAGAMVDGAAPLPGPSLPARRGEEAAGVCRGGAALAAPEKAATIRETGCFIFK
jgi:hypothetical protein